MRIPLSSRRALGIVAAVAMLAGCGGLQSQTGGTGPIPQAGASHAKKANDLLYFAESPATVAVYSYPKAKYETALTADLDNVGGECAASNGNWWVVNEGNDEILGYAHGGTSPTSTLTESNGEPLTCGEDPTTGNLAVAILTTGDILVYANASGNPTVYSTSLMEASYVSYDNKGNLFADGFTASDAFELIELTKGSGSFKTITLNQTFGFPSALEWDGKYLAVGDSGSEYIYQFTISGSQGTKAGSVELKGAGYVTAFWVDGSEAVVVGGRKTGIWNYPAGGKPIVTISHLKNPQGVVVSAAK